MGISFASKFGLREVIHIKSTYNLQNFLNSFEKDKFGNINFGFRLGNQEPMKLNSHFIIMIPRSSAK